MPPNPEGIGLSVTRHDWRPIWNLVQEIQALFKAGGQFTSGHQRQAAWERFQELRSTASRRAQREREKFIALSTDHRESILYMCKGLGYSRIDDILFFFDPVTTHDMRAQGRTLADAMKRLSEWKTEMLAEHKQQCFDRFQVIREQHALFWSQYKEARDVRHRQFQERRAELVERTRNNLEKNRRQLESAMSALSRHQDKARSLRQQIAESNSEKWRGIWGGWLSETEDKITDIEASIDRIRSWISEGEGRLTDLIR